MSDRPDVDAIVDTFPIVEFARMSKVSVKQVRQIAQCAVRNAIDNGGHPHSVGKVMRIAVDAAARKR